MNDVARDRVSQWHVQDHSSLYTCQISPGSIGRDAYEIQNAGNKLEGYLEDSF